ncbi:profilin-1-like [Trematomus bernacchii]|uniref:Profilin n=1 Tax=Pagothenia borchgrevinki TaxID=8213 RepID=A0ABD2GBU3_PAGBO|nr:profilin-1-like [Trematomus bernacchii]
MSWDGYITSLMAATDGVSHVSGAAICGQDGSTWAASDNMKCITAEEVKKLIGDTSTFHQSGPVVAGMKCMMIRDQYEDPSSYCLQLKSRKDAEGNTFNICVGKTTTAVVIAKGTKEANGGQVTAKVYTIVSYLRGAGY